MYLCMCVFSPNGQFLVTLGKHLLCSIKAPCGSGHGWTGAAVSEDHGGVFSYPWSDVHSSCSQGTAALCDSMCVYSSSVVTDCKCLCLKDLWERVERVRAVRAVPSSCGSAMSRESWRRTQGCWTTNGTCSPCGVPMPDGYSCIKWIGLIYEPLLLTERWKACIWICDFLCDLPTSYFISQSWSLDM